MIIAELANNLIYFHSMMKELDFPSSIPKGKLLLI